MIPANFTRPHFRVEARPLVCKIGDVDLVADPKEFSTIKERLVGYIKAEKAREVEGTEGYRVQWDAKTAKTRNLDHARESAVWPDATDEELTAPGLEERLVARLPALMAEFKAAVESLGFTY